jgi:hypothetical protein
MSKLDEAMLEHMRSITYAEHRPFSFLDFLRFEVNGKEYKMQHGTFRNKIMQLLREHKVELAYNAGIAFYTLKGIAFGKPKFTMTPNRTGVPQDPIIKLIQNLPMDRRALHDIRFRLQVPGIWSILSTSSQLVAIDPISKDIRLMTCETDGLLIRITVHKTNTITVIVACSCSPVAIDISGIIRLSNALTRVEERLSKLVHDCLSISANSSSVTHNQQEVIIPAHNNWIVTLWHFGSDSLVRYAGEKFEVTWEVAENILVRVYTKDLKEKGTRIRVERQEYPNKTFVEAVDEKLNTQYYNGHMMGRRMN